MNPGIEDIRRRGSRILTDGAKMLPAASLMKAEGLIRSFNDLSKPIVTIVNSYTTQIPGHAHLDKLGALLKEELESLGFNVWYTNVGAAICDGIAMGHFGMKYSLPSRELSRTRSSRSSARIPRRLDRIGNCDKIVPAMLQRHGADQYPGGVRERRADAAGAGRTDLITVFEGVGTQRGKMSRARSLRDRRDACPSCGSCAGMFTANSMNCLAEAIGLALPGNGTIPAGGWTARNLYGPVSRTPGACAKSGGRPKRCMEKKSARLIS